MVNRLVRLLRSLVIPILVINLLGASFAPINTVYADKLGVCGTPGKDGSTTTLSGVVNSYYPGAANVSIGSTSIPIGAARAGGGPAITAGDLLLVVQMQGADIDSTNTNNYGNGVGNGGTAINTVTYPTGDPDYAGGTVAANFSAGLYEYVVATGPVVGGFVPVSSGLENAYFYSNNSGGSSQGQRRFQVVRIPQYSNASLSGPVTALGWDGSTGGIVAIDVAGQLDWNGQSVDVSGLGFRGGGGRQLSGSGGLNWWDFRTLATATTNGSKGEGYAGTPRYLNDNGTLLDNGLEGYANGSYGRGGAGNAGGGSTDGNPGANDQNSGGGGGGNGGYGGMGGNSWSSGIVSGGYGGAPFPGTAPRLIMGGGGGAGTTNNGTGLAGGFSSSGRAGGGVVFIRSGTITGTGTINADGSDAPVRGDTDVVLNDGGGGGGAGGSIVVIALNGGGSIGTLTATAAGGQGGDAWPDQGGAGSRHGPGGGGGGGFIYTSGSVGAGSNVAGGINGISTTANDPFGATAGGAGILVTNVTSTDLPASISGANCVAVSLTTTKTTSTPSVVAGNTAVYTITVSNVAGISGASGVEISDLLPSGFTYASTDAVSLVSNAVRQTVSNPVVGSGNPTWGTFLIPGGGSVSITFTVDVGIATPSGTYQNPATSTFLDPVRTTPTDTLTSSYDPASSTGEDVTVVAPELSITKTSDSGGDSDGYVNSGDTITYTIEIENNSAVTHHDIVVTDAVPVGTSFVSGSVDGYQVIELDYRDDFDSGTTYNQSDGLTDWSGQSWTEVNDDGDPEGGTIRIIDGGDLLRLENPSGDYVYRTVPGDLSGKTVTLNTDFDEVGNFEGGDEFTIDVWDGANWQVIVSYTNDFEDPPALSADISGYANADTRIRYWSNATGNGPGEETIRIYYAQVLVEDVIAVNDVPINSPANIIESTDGYILNAGQTMTITYQVVVDDVQPGQTEITNVASTYSDEQLNTVEDDAIDTIYFGSLTVIKDALPNDSEDFSYTVTGTGLSAFTLDDDFGAVGEDLTYDTTATFTDLETGTYTIAETVPANWEVSDILCSGGTNSTVTIGAVGGFDTGDTDISIDLIDGEDITCTFENTYQNTATIGDYIWQDSDGEGDQDEVSAGIAGVTVQLVTAGLDGLFGTLDDVEVATDTTDANGAYDFTDLAADDYRVNVTDTGGVLTGYILTTANEPLDITLTDAEDYNDAEPGLIDCEGADGECR